MRLDGSFNCVVMSYCAERTAVVRDMKQSKLTLHFCIINSGLHVFDCESTVVAIHRRQIHDYSAYGLTPPKTEIAPQYNVNDIHGWNIP